MRFIKNNDSEDRKQFVINFWKSHNIQGDQFKVDLMKLIQEQVKKQKNKIIQKRRKFKKIHPSFPIPMKFNAKQKK